MEGDEGRRGSCEASVLATVLELDALMSSGGAVGEEERESCHDGLEPACVVPSMVVESGGENRAPTRANYLDLVEDDSILLGFELDMNLKSPFIHAPRKTVPPSLGLEGATTNDPDATNRGLETLEDSCVPSLSISKHPRPLPELLNLAGILSCPSRVHSRAFMATRSNPVGGAMVPVSNRALEIRKSLSLNVAKNPLSQALAWSPMSSDKVCDHAVSCSNVAHENTVVPEPHHRSLNQPKQAEFAAQLSRGRRLAAVERLKRKRREWSVRAKERREEEVRRTYQGLPIRYECRKKIADGRPRVGGRFVRTTGVTEKSSAATVPTTTRTAS